MDYFSGGGSAALLVMSVGCWRQRCGQRRVVTARILIQPTPSLGRVVHQERIDLSK
jgi:hypothetical protein